MRVLAPGSATAPLVRLDEAVSFWGGYDPERGVINDRAHPQFGLSLAGMVVAMPHGRGSSSSSSVLAEALRIGTGPAALVLEEPDSILVVGALVARMLYEVSCPVIVGPIEGESGDIVTVGG